MYSDGSHAFRVLSYLPAALTCGPRACHHPPCCLHLRYSSISDHVFDLQTTAVVSTAAVTVVVPVCVCIGLCNIDMRGIYIAYAFLKAYVCGTNLLTTHAAHVQFGICVCIEVI